MQVLVEIPDNKVNFGLEVLRSLDFIKKAKPMSQNKIDLWEDLKTASSEVKLHIEGKVKLKTAQQILNEL